MMCKGMTSFIASRFFPRYSYKSQNRVEYYNSRMNTASTISPGPEMSMAAGKISTIVSVNLAGQHGQRADFIGFF